MMINKKRNSISFVGSNAFFLLSRCSCVRKGILAVLPSLFAGNWKRKDGCASGVDLVSFVF